MMFMNAAPAGDVGVAELTAWLRTNLVEPGFMPSPVAVREPDVGTVSLVEPPAEAWAASIDARAGRIAAVAQERVSAALLGLVAHPVDDRFLSAAIFSGRVRRASADGVVIWRPSLLGTERLSDIVLALLAADALTHRDDYESQLRSCESCGQVCMCAAGTPPEDCQFRRPADPGEGASRP
jgi:hypothetical protein